MKIRKIEVSATVKDLSISYTLIRQFDTKQNQYLIWVYNHLSETGKYFVVTKNQFFKKLKQLKNENVISYCIICTENGYCLIYSETGAVFYSNYKMPKF